MNYVRTCSGGMMPITSKSNSIISKTKQRAIVKSSKKSKSDPASESK
jgi:hypothetical protein